METVKCNGNRFIHTTVSVNIHKPLPPEKKKKINILFNLSVLQYNLFIETSKYSPDYIICRSFH